MKIPFWKGVLFVVLFVGGILAIFFGVAIMGQ